MRRFVDLSIKPQGLNELKEIIDFASRFLEISVLGLERGALCDEGKRIARDYGVDIVCRITLKGETRRDIAKGLSKYRKVRDFIRVVEVRTLDVARYAAVKEGVDVIRFEPEAYRYVDKSQATLIRNGGFKPIEISLRPAILDLGNLPKILEVIRRAFSFDIKIILVSDAMRKYELIHPLSMAGIANLAEVPEDLALSYVSTIPMSVIERSPLKT
jgi:ribonuclease P/MRP protein subunit RPP1